MAVVANFTADVVSGCEPLTVTFTDTSTGSPTNWHWDFGDGFTSSEQNPVHTYVTNGSFTVSLRAFISTGQTYFPNSNPSTADTLTSREYKESAPRSSDAEQERSDFASASFAADTLHFIGFIFNRTDAAGGFFMNGTKGIASIDLTGLSGIAFLETKFTTVDIISGAFIISGITKSSDNVTSFEPLVDVSGSLGSIYIAAITDASNFSSSSLPEPANNQSSGYLIVGIRIAVHSFGAGDDDTETKTDFINIGPPTASFTLIPSVDQSPVSVDFTNTSGGGFTYSWKRRISNTSDPFVEFSTDENPTEIFNKLSP